MSEKMGRGDFLRTLGLVAAGKFLGANSAVAQKIEQETRPDGKGEQLGDKTTLTDSGEKFKNGDSVFRVNFKPEGAQFSKDVGELWPVNLMNFVTKESDPDLFKLGMGELLEKAGAVASSPDGMTKAANGYVLEGKSIARGVEVGGDGAIPKYGIVILNKGKITKFTHALELIDYNPDGSINDQTRFDKLYNEVKSAGGSLFFLPSVMRTYNNEKKKLEKETKLEQVLIRRLEPSVDNTGKRIPNGNSVETYKVVRFELMVSYKDAIRIVEGLDRQNPDNTTSATTHIFMLDGGEDWDRAAKKVNKGNGDEVEVLSEGKKELATAAVVLY